MSHYILVVDDEPDIESLLSQKFRREIRKGEYQFRFVRNGAEALSCLEEMPEIDMVLTDINMPVMDGLTLLSKLQNLAHSPKTVIVSAYSDIANIRMAMNNGAFDFLTKPINFQDLDITLKKTLKAVVKEKENRERLEQAQLQLVQSEKMSALGQMVAGIAHEINNPVNFIHGNLKPAKGYIEDLQSLIKLYQENYPEPAEKIQAFIEDVDLAFLQDDLNKLFESLSVGTARIRELVLSLRNFSRLDEATQKAVDIHEGIENTLVILKHRLTDASVQAGISIEREYGNLPLVECYPSQLNQVVMNLITNAIDALEAHHASLQSQGAITRPGMIRIVTDVLEDGWIRIVVSDNGPGIEEGAIAKLFDPFFTTKPVGKGTGLGLSICHQIIVEKHGGKLSCQSTLGEGTQFLIEIPSQKETRSH